MSKRYTEGICGDGDAILDNGKQITVTEILNRLNRLNRIENKPKYYDVEFSNICKAKIKLHNNKINVEVAINGGGCVINKSEIKTKEI